MTKVAPSEERFKHLLDFWAKLSAASSWMFMFRFCNLPGDLIKCGKSFGEYLPDYTELTYLLLRAEHSYSDSATCHEIWLNAVKLLVKQSSGKLRWVPVRSWPTAMDGLSCHSLTQQFEETEPARIFVLSPFVPLLQWKATSVFRTLVMSVYQKSNFLINQPKHMLWVLKRTISMRRFFWAPKTYVKTDG